MDGCKEGKGLSLASRAHHFLKETDTHLNDRHKFQSTELSNRYAVTGLAEEVIGWWDSGVGQQAGGEKGSEEAPGGLSLTFKKGRNCSWQPGRKDILG